MIRGVWNTILDWFWDRVVFGWFERHPQHQRTPEQQAHYEAECRAADERARIHYIDQARRNREETP